MICKEYKTCRENNCLDFATMYGNSYTRLPHDYDYDHRNLNYDCNKGLLCCELIPITQFQFLLWKKTCGDR